MSPEEYAEMVKIYCTVTGAPLGVEETLSKHHRTIVVAWKCTSRDLGEIAYRLVAEKRIPRWPNEHLAAIGAELDRLRAEQSAKIRPPRTEHQCSVCEGIGLVIVPHPCCVHEGRVTGFYDHRARIRRREVVTCAVICTAPKCWAGERAMQANRAWAGETNKPKMLTMDGYLRRVGLYFEPTVTLRAWEKEQAAMAREAEPRTDGERDIFRSLIGNILARQKVWAEQPYRDDAEVEEGAIPA